MIDLWYPVEAWPRPWDLTSTEDPSFRLLGRLRLLRQLFVEGWMFSALALGISLLLANWLIEALRVLIPLPAAAAAEGCIRLNPRIAGFSLVLSLCTAVAFVLPPALYACRASLVPGLKPHRGALLRLHGVPYGFHALVITQLGVALTLMTTAGLLFRSYAQYGSVDLGFQKKNILLTDLQLDKADENQQQAFFSSLVTHLASWPRVKNVSLSLCAPFSITELGGGERSALLGKMLCEF